MSSVIHPRVDDEHCSTNYLSRSPALQHFDLHPCGPHLCLSSTRPRGRLPGRKAKRKALAVLFKYPEQSPDGLAARILYKYESSMQIFPPAAALPPLLHLSCRPLGHPASSSSTHKAMAPIISYHRPPSTGICAGIPSGRHNSPARPAFVMSL